jgi:hypothetical protein
MITDDRTVEAFLEDRLLNHETTKLAPKIRNDVGGTTHAGNQLKDFASAVRATPG